MSSTQDTWQDHQDSGDHVDHVDHVDHEADRVETDDETGRFDSPDVGSSDVDSEAGPVLLPTDAPEPTDDSRTSVDEPAVAMTEGDPVTDVEARYARYDSDNADIESADADGATVGPDTETGALSDPVPEGTFATDATTDVGYSDPGGYGSDPADVSSDPVGYDSDPADVSSDPGEVTSDPADAYDATPAVVVPDPGLTSDTSQTEPTTDATTDVTTDTPADEGVDAPIVTHGEWHELQGRFVDDPEGAVAEAGEKVAQALAELRSRIEKGSTEDLRTAFRRYRDLFAALD